MAAIYLLVHSTEPRFKLGCSVAPQHRMLSLPEYTAGEVDLEASRAVWVDSFARAQEVERSMHKLLRRSSYITLHRGDGHTEWFSTVALQHAIQLLQQVPQDKRLSQFARVQPFLSEPPAVPVPVDIDDGIAQETWLHVEDLLLRMARLVKVEVVCEPEPAVRFLAVRRRWSLPPSMSLTAVQSGAAELASLRRAVMNADTYQFRRQDRLYSFIRWIDYSGDDVVMQFTPFNTMRTWDLDTDLSHHVRTLLLRLPLMCSWVRPRALLLPPRRSRRPSSR